MTLRVRVLGWKAGPGNIPMSPIRLQLPVGQCGIVCRTAGRTEGDIEVKSIKWLMLAGMAILLMTMGCEKQRGLVAPEEGDVGVAATSTLPYQYNPGGSWFTYFRFLSPGPQVRDLSVGNDAGGNGSVTVWKAADALYVQYQTTNGWFLAQVHVAVATNLDDIPHNKSGNLQPGKFPFPPKDEFGVDPYANLHIVEIPWDDDWDISPPDSLYMVAHCIVGKEVAPGETIWQTGTGGGGDPGKHILLPDPAVLVDMSVHHTGTNCDPYWVTTLSGVPGYAPYDPYNVWDGTWNGWCAEEGVSIHDGFTYQVHLYSSLTLSALPDGDLKTRLLKNDEWDRVNWVINYKSNWPCPPNNNEVFHNAFYMILGETTYPHPTDNLANAIYEDAAANGDGFYPGPGEWFAVLCVAEPHPNWPDETPQLVFIEVDP